MAPIVDDGTCWDGLPLTFGGVRQQWGAALVDRQRYGHGYRNESLEAKRRAAIEWLRQKSRVGWACDQVKEKANG